MTQELSTWNVLLIGGPSGVGKTTVAAQLGRRFGMSWLQVDDLRLALQYSHATLPQGNDALYFFLQTPDVWYLQPERLRDGLIGVGRAMSDALEIVVAHHADTAAPVVIEGDGILPSLFDRPGVHERMRCGHVAAVFVVEPDQEQLHANMLRRARGLDGRTDRELRNEAHAKWLFGQWLAAQAQRYGLPLLEARPQHTLAERIAALCAATGMDDQPSSGLIVRDAVDADVPALTAIKGPASEAIHRDRLQDAHKPGFRYLVLVAHHRPIGFACLVLRRPDSWSDAGDPHHLPQIVDLEIHHAHRGQGYGSRFVREMEHLAAAAGYRELYIAVDPVENPRANALYQRLGYRPIQSAPYRTRWELTDSAGAIHQGEEWTLDLVKQLASGATAPDSA